HDVLERYDELRARRLPAGDQIWGRTQSSGTTGRRVVVLHSVGSMMMYSILRHRNSRWHRLNPMGTRLGAKPRSDMVSQRATPAAGFVRIPEWRYLGRFFHTGPEFEFPISDPMDRQVEYLQEIRPDYATSLPGVFEEWLLANNGEAPVTSLKSLMGVG